MTLLRSCTIIHGVVDVVIVKIKKKSLNNDELIVIIEVIEEDATFSKHSTSMRKENQAANYMWHAH